MKMPLKILIRLLEGEHFSVEERKNLDLWPNETLRYNEVASHFAKVLESSEWFPKSLSAIVDGEAVREGIYIHQEKPNRFVCIAQRTLADNPSVLAERTETVFDSSCAAADYYLKWELNLPGRLDGWIVK